jgi:hypothetical protein
MVDENLALGKLLYSITDTGYIVIYNSTYNYANDENIIRLIIKHGKVLLDDEFNAPIPFIVDGVRILICGREFNQPLDNLPCSLRILQISSIRGFFGCEFSKSLKTLPHGLEDLRLFGLQYNETIPSDFGIYLPSTIKYLYINIEWIIDINVLPDSIEELYISEKNIILENVCKIPTNLKLLCGSSAHWKFREKMKAKFPRIEIQSVCLVDYKVQIQYSNNWP